MNIRSHIVHFSAKSRKSDELTEYRPLPVLIKNIQSICIDELEANLVMMLNTADDRLFDMAETSYNNAQFDAMRLLRIKRDGLISSFKHELANNFQQTLGKLDGPEFSDENIESLSFENIALVKDDDLEEDIATDAMINKAKTKNRTALEHIRIRIDAIITDKSVEQQNNPLEPVYICDAFRTASQTLDLDIASLLVIYKLFDRSVIFELDVLYQKVNQFFIDKGILPDLKGDLIAPVRQNTPTPSQSNQDSQQVAEGIPVYSDAVEALPINEPVENYQANQAVSQNRPLSGQTGVFSAIQQLMSAQRNTNAGSIASDQPQIPQLSDDVAIPAVDTQQLLQALSNIQISQQHIPTATQQIQPINLRESIGGQLPTAENQLKQGSFGQFNEDMIDVVSMLFDFILEDENLQPELKSIIARLQIPMLKVGLVEKTCFSNRRHLARTLLNELAHAGLSWDEKDRSAKAMFEKISETAERVIQEFTSDVSLFSELLEDFLEFKQQNQQRANIFERRTREAEEGKARSETARSAVNKNLTAICKGKNIPDVVKAILKNVWSHVMLLERLKENEDGWKRRIKVAQLLVWSVQPVQTANRLEKLTSKVPLLVKSLRKGMEQISYSPIESTTAFEQLEKCHRDLIEVARNKINQLNEEEILRLPARNIDTDSATSIEGNEQDVIDSEENSSPIYEEIIIEDIGFTKLETGQLLHKESPEPVHIDASVTQTVEQLRAGSWVELKIESEFKRCKLAARIATTGKYIFVNRSGMKMAEFLTAELCQYLQLGNLKILDDEALFDRALESVISNLRSLKAQA